jgi:cellulose synthase/poly-beta-1,6-N-acetylglucosamine synthase-like glycosyltransferase
LIYLAALLLAAQLVQIAMLLHGRSRSHFLPREFATPPAGWPMVSIVVPARDEEAEIEAALRSVLALDYPAFEVIVVNDRSTDRTGEVLERMRAEHPQLQVVTVAELPAGWLGKNHALHRGVQQARGEWLLFTDADVVFDPSTLQRAIALADHDGLDHLTLSPAVRSQSFWINMLTVMFVRNFTLYVRPWKARDPKSPCAIGLGAFNLVRRSAYEKVGGHETIRLRPDDDLKLGKILKQAGHRQDFAVASDALHLQWYPSVWAMARGLEKNVLAGVDYRLGLLLFALAVTLLGDVGPWLLIPFGDLWTLAIALAAGLLSMFSLAIFYPQLGWCWGWAFLAPILTVILCWIFLRSALLTLYRGGISWRGSFYPLHELKQNRV